MNEQAMLSFIEHSLEKVYFYIESRFWSKPTLEELNNWLDNFKTTEEKYCASKLLDRFVFYSEKDIIRLLNYGLYEKILNRKFLKQEINSDFNLSNSEFIKIKDDFNRKVRFIPLYQNNQSESCLAMLRILTNDLGINEKNILELDNLKSEDLTDCENLIIIDDFIGSGKQITDFWNFREINLDGKLQDENNLPIKLNSLKTRFPKLDIEYLCLVCTKEGLDKFNYNFDFDVENNLRITYCELLEGKFKIFGEESTYFDLTEMSHCKKTIEDICLNAGIDFLGYEALDYAIAFHHSIPDCSLPLFFTENEKWYPLFRNKRTIKHE